MPVKYTVEISQNFVALSEYKNFMQKWSWAMHVLELSVQNEIYDRDQKVFF